MELQELIALVKETKTFVENRERAGHIRTKGCADYVTQVDTDIQSFLARELGRRFPDIQFLGEEEGLHEMSGDTYWILDPIDGTTNLIHDYRHSVVSLALYEKGETALGIIYDPFRGCLLRAEGKGQFPERNAHSCVGCRGFARDNHNGGNLAIRQRTGRRKL